MLPQAYNVAVVGSGRMGQIHAFNASENRRTKLKFICSRTQSSTAVELAQRLGASVVTFEEAIQDPQIDLVLVCSATTIHCQHICAALEAGKHVFVEKPTALSLSDINKCYETATKAKKTLFTAFQRRFDPHFLSLKKQLDSGAIGEPQVIRLISRDHPPPSTAVLSGGAGSFTQDFAAHDLDMAIWFLGPNDPIQTAFCRASSFLPNYKAAGQDDTASLVLTSKSGAIVIIENSRRTSYGYDIRAEILGSKGMLELRNPKPTSVVLANGDGFREDNLFHSFPERFESAYKAELDHFLDSIQNSVKVSVTHEHCQEIARITALAEESRNSQPKETKPSDISAAVQTQKWNKPNGPINVAIFGAGRMGRVRAEAIKKISPHVNLIMVVDIYEPAVKQFGLDFNCKSHVLTDSNLKQLMSRDDINVVFICTTSETHCQLIVSACEEKKHIFVEKPMAVSKEEAEVCFEAVKKAEVILYCGFQRANDPHFERLFNVVGDSIPELIRFTARDSMIHNSLQYLLTSGHQVYDSLIHEIHFSIMFAKSDPVEVYGVSGSFRKEMKEKGKEDCVVGLIKFENGTIATIDNHRWAPYGYDQRAEIHTSKGSFSVDNVRNSLLESSVAGGIFTETSLHNGIDRYLKAYEGDVNHFVAVLLGREEKPKVTVVDCVLVNRVADALIESMKTGKPVVL